MISLSAQAFSVILSLGSIAILARLLAPADFGLVAMVMSLTGILGMFKDAGLSMATVQREDVTPDQVSTLFWFNVGLSLVLMLASVALAPVIAWFYGEPKLFPIALAVAGLFLVDGLSVQHQALIRRQMQYGALAKIQIISSVLALGAAIASALSGAGYWALIVQASVSQITTTFLSWLFCGWIPGKPRRGTGVRSMLKFGGYLTGFSFVNYFSRNADNILIGKAWGGVELGLYSRAYSLLLFPLQQINSPISAVAIPALSRLQNNPEEFRDFFRKTLGVTTFVTFPLVALIIICRHELVLIFLGSQWGAAVPIFSLLAISAFLQPIGNITGILYIALGRTERMFKWGLMSSSWIVTSFFIGLPFGAQGVALAYSLAVVIMIIPLILYAISGTFLTLGDFLSGIKYPGLSTLFASLISLAVHKYFSASDSPWLPLAITTPVMLIGYLISMLKLNPHIIRDTARLLLKPKKNSE